GDTPPISSVMCFQLQPLCRLMSRIFSVSCSRRKNHPSILERLGVEAVSAKKPGAAARNSKRKREGLAWSIAPDASILLATTYGIAASFWAGARHRSDTMAKVVCVLYDDPVNGYPKKYARDDIPKITKYPDGQTAPTPSAIDFEPGQLLGSV